MRPACWPSSCSWSKRDAALEERFLVAHYHEMPRTMLRYAIEKLPPARRQAYLLGRI